MKTGDSYSTDIRYVDIEMKIFRIKDKVSLKVEVPKFLMVRSHCLTPKQTQRPRQTQILIN